MALDTASWERIARYALGECTAEEALETRAWIEADAERKALADELTQLAGAGPTTMWDARAAWRRFRATVGEEESAAAQPLPWLPVEPPQRPPQRTATSAAVRTRRRWLAAAAAVLLAASAALVWQTTVWQTTRDSVPGVVASDELRAISTQPGQTAELYLSDGTHVTLGVASTLRFPESFQGARDVVLAGEAYFDVAPETPSLWRRLSFWQQKRDFTVHTEHGVARDLGTRFSVRAYPDSPSTEVVVAEGAVALAPAAPAGTDSARQAARRHLKRPASLPAERRPTRRSAASAHQPTTASPVTDSLVLAPGDLGRIEENGSIAVLRGIDVDAYLAWMQGRLVFTDAPLSEVLERFRHWYDVDLQVADAVLAEARLTATFDTDSPEEALELLAAVLDAHIERRGQITELRQRGR